MAAGILFDFDDTLVETTVYFNVAKDRFAGIMEGLGFPPEEALNALNRFDIENVRKCGGFFKQCFPEALGQTYEFYCKSYGVAHERLRRKEIEGLGWWVFSQPVRPVPGAEDVLSSLHGRFPFFWRLKETPACNMKESVRAGCPGGLRAYTSSLIKAVKPILKLLPSKT